MHVKIANMQRYKEDIIRQDIEDRIVLLSGPRQVGKTTLSKALFSSFDYLNHDLAEHRTAIRQRSWDRARDLLILDELHKMKSWKAWLKGIYDVEGVRPRLLVTGSARMDLARKMGDSLAGRFFGHRLHPLDLRELKGQVPAREAFDTLVSVGGFPEPFLKGSRRFYNRWRRSHLDIVLRQDLIDLEAVNDIQSIETLVELLRNRVGSTVSMSSLARDLEVAPRTVKRWITLLENLYIVFIVRPYHRNIARSILKEPKIYFYDIALVDDAGARLENLVACSLKKDLDRMEDERGARTGLHYLRTKDGREIDFAVLIDGSIDRLVEVKTSDGNPSPAFRHFDRFISQAARTQLVLNLDRERTYPDGVEVRSLIPWLSDLDLDKKRKSS